MSDKVIISKVIYNKMVKMNKLNQQSNSLGAEINKYFVKNNIYGEDDEYSDVLIDTLDYGVGDVDTALKLLDWEVKK